MYLRKSDKPSEIFLSISIIYPLKRIELLLCSLLFYKKKKALSKERAVGI